MRRVAILGALLLCTAQLASAPAGRAGTGVPDAVREAAAYNATMMKGALVEERHIDLQASAGPVHFSQQNDALVFIEDGQYKRVRYTRIVENGKTIDPDKVAQRERENNSDLEQGRAFFKQPYDMRYLHDYTYAENGCTCGAGEREIAFHSVLRDDQHGDGTMRIELSTGRVLNVTYTPNVLPQHASTGTTVETFGEAVPGVWTIVSIDRSYDGRVAFIHGSGKMTERLDHFQRFVNAATAMQYLQRATT